MGKLALEKGYSLFPEIEKDCSKILLILISKRVKEGELSLVKIMEQCQFEGLHNVFLPEMIKEFFDEKCETLKNLEIKVETGFSRIFDYIERDDMMMSYSFEINFYEGSVKE